MRNRSLGFIQNQIHPTISWSSTTLCPCQEQHSVYFLLRLYKPALSAIIVSKCEGYVNSFSVEKCELQDSLHIRTFDLHITSFFQHQEIHAHHFLRGTHVHAHTHKIWCPSTDGKVKRSHKRQR